MDTVEPVLLEKSSKAKRLILTVKPFKGVRVAVPKGASFQEAEAFVISKKNWITKNLKEIRKVEKDYNDRKQQKYSVDRQEAIQVLTVRTEELALLYGFRFDRLTIRNQKTRWGSCSATNNISLNMKLLLLPDELRDYIILHELIHTRVKNHSKIFWDELLKVEPLSRLYSKEINKYNLSFL